MSTRFTQHGVGQSEPREADQPALERQQVVLLERLSRAAGAPVSYAQLHDAGIEFPASVVSELELAGVSIERCHLHTRDGRRLVGVRLDPPRERSELHTRSSAAVLRRARGNAARALRAVRDGRAGVTSRWPAPAALLAAAGAVAALLLLALSGGGHAHHVIAQRRHRPLRPAVSAAARSHASGSSQAHSAVGPPTQPAHRPPAPTPVSPVLAAQLQAHGHDLLEAGRYGDAVALLQRSLAATGEDLQGCLQPTGETCLTYAYALYDLGRALRLNGDPVAAVPVLQRRLRIENQRPTVQAQLELALAQAS